MKNIFSMVTLLSLGLITSLTAGGTAPNISVSNSATLNYTVSGVSQTELSASDGGFVVDRKIDLTVANTITGKTINVTPNTTGQILTYTVANLGNDSETFDLTVVHADNSNGASDDFNTLSCKIFDGANEITSLTLIADGSKSIDVKCAIPTAGTPTVQDDQTSKVWLVATVNGRTKANDNVDDPLVVQDVFADGASADSYSSDSSFDGKHSDMGTYHVATAKLDISKTSVVIKDPVTEDSGATKPHRIPGATVRYCFQVDNTGSSDAAGVHISDDLSLTNRDKLTYIKSGKVLQDITTPCDCAGITDTSGGITGSTVDIDLGTVTSNTATARACAYIETTIN